MFPPQPQKPPTKIHLATAHVIPFVAKAKEIHKPFDTKNTSFLLLRLLLLQKHFSFCAISQPAALVSRQLPARTPFHNTQLLMKPYGLLIKHHYSPSTAPTYRPCSASRSCPDCSSMCIIHSPSLSSSGLLSIAAASSRARCQ